MGQKKAGRGRRRPHIWALEARREPGTRGGTRIPGQAPAGRRGGNNSPTTSSSCASCSSLLLFLSLCFFLLQSDTQGHDQLLPPPRAAGSASAPGGGERVCVGPARQPQEPQGGGPASWGSGPAPQLRPGLLPAHLFSFFPLRTSLVDFTEEYSAMSHYGRQTLQISCKTTESAKGQILCPSPNPFRPRRMRREDPKPLPFLCP